MKGFYDVVAIREFSMFMLVVNLKIYQSQGYKKAERTRENDRKTQNVTYNPGAELS